MPAQTSLTAAIIPGFAGLLAQTNESGAKQALELGIFFRTKLLSHPLDGSAHGFATEPRVKIGELTQSEGGLAARLRFFGAEATGVVIQDFGRGRRILAIE